MSIISWISGAVESVANFVKTEIAKIEGDVPQIEAALENAATIADNAVNALKTFVASPVGKTIEGVLEAVPGIGPYLTDVLNFLPTLVVDLGWAVTEFNKSPAQVLQDGINTAVNAANVNVKATNLAVLQAHINTFVSGLSHAPISIQGALSLSPTIHVGITGATTSVE
jgi:phage-related protein